MEKRSLKKTGAGSRGLKVVRGFAFYSSPPLDVTMKLNLVKVLGRLSSFTRNDFSDKSMLGPATHLLKRPGKLLRPALVFLGAGLIGESYEKFIDLAAGAEILHTASLIHDDIIDEDARRRGMTSVHSMYGNETAILAGDALIAKGVMLISRYGLSVTSAMAKAALDMCAGELIDHSFSEEERAPETREYLKVARLKSGSLLGTCCSIVPLYRNDGAAGELFSFGMNAGIAFQIRDDVLETVDSTESKRNSGKEDATAFRSNIVGIIRNSLGCGTQEATERAVALNNYFADRALGSIKSKEMKSTLSDYIEFVRITKQ